ncbi:MAG: PilT/PilU family type 4a pilus ATPase [Deltaproteobacteria bacterium]|nr:PilT/PilU family type 4a pilus ATPase [Deltaproteobacteria bacterium]MDQ3298070.1 PilT/PilU family type 4a pilus ATPase [Myxococcota bacterium]
MKSNDQTWDPSLRGLLEHMLKVDASDLYLTAESPPVFRIDGIGYPAKVSLNGEQIAAMARTLLTKAQHDELLVKKEMNVAVASSAGGRFRVNMFYQRGELGLVIRLVRTAIKTLADLKHPPVLAEIMNSKRGLVLLVGGTGSGKSTTLAAMINHRNEVETGHIITIEDPVEFIHPHKQCVVTQREVGVDTLSYRDALKNTLRQAPDVILIGEIRDVETMEAAITFAETGHLCISTLHANNANQAIERILNFFPPGRQAEIRLQLSLNLRAIVSQRLLPALAGGRAAALEVLIDTPRIRDLIKRGDVETIKEAMEQGVSEGCCTFDEAMYDLFCDGRIEESEAIRAADSPNNLRMRIDRFRRQGGSFITEPELRLIKDDPPRLAALKR